MTIEDLKNQQMVDGNNKAAVMKLSVIIIFLSGSRYLNKEVQIKVSFTRTATERLYVSTCNHEITFPVNERYISSDFTQNVTDDIVSSPGFGNV